MGSVLVVDDERVTCDIVVDALVHFGFEAMSRTSADAALGVLERAPKRAKVDQDPMATFRLSGAKNRPKRSIGGARSGAQRARRVVAITERDM